MQAFIAFVSANFMNIAVGILVLDRALERIFPNATVLKKLDEVMSNMGIKA